ncbi:MAG: hypothetical protein WAW17_13320 [Rhodococcus sp. (in: high G+C Gram-positive bacteria)]|uniref:T3SS (YopN, CesT) and YbjN peptide-binding chaperone 1 n=1 Tax=Rhodococcus sp. TaxID=1831 RepID=UPI003BAF3AF6
MSDNIFDREIDSAWAEFQDRLSEYVRTMVDDDELVLQLHHDSTDDGLAETAACVRFFAWAGNTVRCEVPSNRFLHPARAFTEEEHERLLELGWHRPDLCVHVDEGNGSASYYIDVDREDGARPASMAVTVFREIWDLTHPSFLLAVTSGREETSGFLTTAATPMHSHPESGLGPLVEKAVETLLGQAPERDVDGDLLVWVGELPTYIRVLEGDRRVEFFAPVVHTVGDRARAADALVELNNHWPDLKFQLVGDNVIVVMRIDGSPFVPEHLGAVFGHLEHFVDTLDDTFAGLLGGTLTLSSDPATGTGEHDCEELPAALMTLIHLDPHGDLEPDDVVEICGRDRNTILGFLRICSEQEIEWHRNAELSRGHDAEEVAMCEGEAQSWGATKDSLRAALRAVVLPHRAPPGNGFPNFG